MSQESQEMVSWRFANVLVNGWLICMNLYRKQLLFLGMDLLFAYFIKKIIHLHMVHIVWIHKESLNSFLRGQVSISGTMLKNKC